MTSGKYNIIGFFWQDSVENAYLYRFRGTINIDKNAKLSGEIKDEIGEAVIKGSINDGKIEFVKDYFTKVSGTKRPILYSLNAVKYQKGETVFCGGWKGTYEIQSDDPRNKPGNAICMIF